MSLIISDTASHGAGTSPTRSAFPPHCVKRLAAVPQGGDLGSLERPPPEVKDWYRLKEEIQQLRETMLGTPTRKGKTKKRELRRQHDSLEESMNVLLPAVKAWAGQHGISTAELHETVSFAVLLSPRGPAGRRAQQIDSLDDDVVGTAAVPTTASSSSPARTEDEKEELAQLNQELFEAQRALLQTPKKERAALKGEVNRIDREVRRRSIVLDEATAAAAVTQVRQQEEEQQQLTPLTVDDPPAEHACEVLLGSEPEEPVGAAKNALSWDDVIDKVGDEDDKAGNSGSSSPRSSDKQPLQENRGDTPEWEPEEDDEECAFAPGSPTGRQGTDLMAAKKARQMQRETTTASERLKMVDSTQEVSEADAPDATVFSDMRRKQEARIEHQMEMNKLDPLMAPRYNAPAEDRECLTAREAARWLMTYDQPTLHALAFACS